MHGTDLCYFHSLQSHSRKPPEERPPLDLAKVIERELRAARHLPRSLDRAREVRSLVELLKELKEKADPDAQEPDWKKKVDSWKKGHQSSQP